MSDTSLFPQRVSSIFSFGTLVGNIGQFDNEVVARITCGSHDEGYDGDRLETSSLLVPSASIAQKCCRQRCLQLYG